jgi:hypothetical protein
MFCSQCGTESQTEARFCQKCGNALSGYSGQPIRSPQPQASQPADESKRFLGGSHHPWRRLFAKTVDISTLGLLALFIIAFGVGVLFPSKAAAFAKALENQVIAGVVLLTVWIPLEAILLSAVGNTPAKWLFGISVKTTDGANLSFQQALRRSFLAALQGMALGIPFVAFFTQIFAYRRLTKTGTTLWDTAANSVVTHKTWSIGRAIMCVVSVLFVLVLISVMSAVGK